jgi:23S rRNA (uracil1939-C5)-methyltransferase
MKRGDVIDVAIETIAFEGKSVARVDGYVVFVHGGVPGDRARVTITRAKKSFAEADLREVLLPSPLRVPPRCRYFGPCGGCRWQHVAYEAQCGFKRQHVIDALERIGGFQGVAVAPTAGATEPYYYRNKMEFSFGTRWLTSEEMAVRTAEGGATGERFALGLHVPGRYDKILDLEECWLQSPVSARIVNAVREFSLQQRIAVYSTESHSGYLRNLVIREGKRTGDLMINVVTREDREEIMRPLTAHLLEKFPETTTVVNNITEKVSQVALGEYERVYHGGGTITERIGKRLYRISANSFFQTNTEQAERLYDTAAGMAAIRSGDVVYDLYSGTGTIALHVADAAREVIGIESVASSVEDAHRNAMANGIGNCRFLLGDLKETLIHAASGGTDLPRPNVVILDPPRAGAHEKVLREIRSLAPRRIVYVSCNPATQARDLKILCEDAAYRIDQAQPVDMFPHTYHIENVVGLSPTQ